jgi:membrane protease YdiL (CAAX protease family)
MKKIIFPLWPILFFASLIPLVRMADVHRQLILLAFSVGSAASVLMSYVLYGKRDFSMGFFGFLLSISMASASILVVYRITRGEFFSLDLSLRHIFSIIAVALMASIAEEFIFRGAILGLLLKYFKNAPVAILLAVQAILFSISHKNNSYTFIFLTFSFGIFFGWTAYRTRSLWFSIGFHFGWDLIIVFATGFHSLNFGHIKGFVIFNAKFPNVDNLVFLLALGWSAIVFKKCFGNFQSRSHGDSVAEV